MPKNKNIIPNKMHVINTPIALISNSYLMSNLIRVFNILIIKPEKITPIISPIKMEITPIILFSMKIILLMCFLSRPKIL